jgi:hypothetical protein
LLIFDGGWLNEIQAADTRQPAASAFIQPSTIKINNRVTHDYFRAPGDIFVTTVIAPVR